MTPFKDFTQMNDQEIDSFANIMAMKIVMYTMMHTTNGNRHISFSDVEDLAGIKKGDLTTIMNSKGVKLCELINEQLNEYIGTIIHDCDGIWYDEEEQDYDLLIYTRYATLYSWQDLMDEENEDDEN